MRYIALCGALALGMFGVAGAAVAQTTTTTVTTLTPQNRTVIEEYVVHERRPSVTVQNYEVRRGTVLPPAVQVYQVPQVEQYRYSVVNNHRVVVDPTTRQVIEVLN